MNETDETKMARMKEAMGWIGGRQEGGRKQHRLIMMRSGHRDHGHGPTKSGASEV
jgi:hypothetical protein